MTLPGDSSPIDPGEAATREFSRARKGYNPTEVRVHITRLTDEIRRLRGQEAALEGQLELARSSQTLRLEDLDPQTISRALGEETVRIIDTAREASEEIRSKAEEKAATVVREAHERANILTSEATELRESADRESRELLEASRIEAEATVLNAQETAEQLVSDATESAATIRHEAQTYSDKVREDIEAHAALAEENADQLLAEAQHEVELARAEAEEIRKVALADAEVIRLDAESMRERREAEAEAAAAEILAAAEGLRASVAIDAAELLDAARRDAAKVSEQATVDAAAEIERAREVGRSMIAETQVARERMIADLAERRHSARQQLEALRAGRERLLEAFATARSAFDGLTDDVVDSLQDARDAADAAARSLPDDTDEVIDKLDRLIAAGATDTELFDAELASGDEPPAVDYVAVAGLEPAVDQVAALHGADELESVETEAVELEVDEPEAVELDAGDLSDELDSDLYELNAVVEVEEDVELTEAVDLEVADDDEIVAETNAEEVDEGDDDGLVVALGSEADDDELDGDELDDDYANDIDDLDLALDDYDDDDDLAFEPIEEPTFGRLRLVSSNTDGPSPIGIEALTAAEESDELDEDDADGDLETAPAAVAGVEALFARLRADHLDEDEDDDDDLDDDLDDEPIDLADDEAPAALASVAVLAAAPQPAPVIDLAAYETGSAVQTAPVAVMSATADLALAHQELLDERDEAIRELLATIGRRVRRVVADQENEVLDLIRRNRKAKTAEAILPDYDAQRTSLEASVGPDLRHVVMAGIDFAQISWHNEAPSDAAIESSCRAAMDQLVGGIVEPLTAKLTKIIANTDDATPDRADLVDAVRRGYREFKTDRLGEVAGDVVTYAYSRGVLAAAQPGQSTCWIVDHSGRPCPDGEDNSLAGAVLVGEEFPTGDVCPPVHSGCRCLLVPADR